MALVKCNECGHMISDRAIECPNCGCPIEKKEEKKMVCEECGAEITPDMDKCPNCGCPISAQNNTPNENEETQSYLQKQRKRFITMAIFVFFAIACGIGVFVWHSLNQEKLLKAQIAEQTEQARLREQAMNEERQRQAEEAQKVAEEERRRRGGTETVVHLHVEKYGTVISSLYGNYGIEQFDNMYLRSKLIKVPKGKVWIYKKYELSGTHRSFIPPRIGNTYSHTFRPPTGKEIKNDEMFKKMGGEVFYIELTIPDRMDDPIDLKVYFVEKDESDY